MKPEKFLPIGSVVRLKKDHRLIMITGYLPQNGVGQKMYDYSGCLFPNGMSTEALLFDRSQIDNVLFLGYQTNLSRRYMKVLEESKAKLDKNIPLEEVIKDIKKVGESKWVKQKKQE